MMTRSRVVLSNNTVSTLTLPDWFHSQLRVSTTAATYVAKCPSEMNYMYIISHITLYGYNSVTIHPYKVSVYTYIQGGEEVIIMC